HGASAERSAHRSHGVAQWNPVHADGRSLTYRKPGRHAPALGDFADLLGCRELGPPSAIGWGASRLMPGWCESGNFARTQPGTFDQRPPPPLVASPAEGWSRRASTTRVNGRRTSLKTSMLTRNPRKMNTT